VPDRVHVTVRGLREVERALDRLPPDALDILKDGATIVARDLANKIRAAARARGRQAARPGRTTRVLRSTFPKVVAGPHVLLIGTEFGANGRYGWYSHPRYSDSPARQFPSRTAGNAGYWFTPTRRAEEPRIRAAHQEMADLVIRAWSA